MKLAPATLIRIARVPVGAGPHGLCVWPLPGRYSLGRETSAHCVRCGFVVGLARRCDDTFVMKRPTLVCASLLMLVACTGKPTSSSTPLPRPTTPAKMASGTRSGPAIHASVIPLGRSGCEPPSPINRGAGFPEVEGSSNKVQLWGLVMAERPDGPVRVNEQVKIVWRITGTGELGLTSIAPDGSRQPLQWGPDLHVSSTFRRPGQEWGAGYLFTQPGCWDLHAVRGNATADVWVSVAR